MYNTFKYEDKSEFYNLIIIDLYITIKIFILELLKIIKI